MNRHLLFVAIEFRLAGILLAIPSVAALLLVADAALTLRQLPSPTGSEPLDIAKYGLIGVMVNVLRFIEPIVHALAGAAAWVVTVIAILALSTLLVATLLYLTGRGIGQQATWARILAILLSVGLAVISCATMTALRRDLAPFAFVPLGLSIYTLWALIWRFS